MLHDHQFEETNIAKLDKPNHEFQIDLDIFLQQIHGGFSTFVSQRQSQYVIPLDSGLKIPKKSKNRWLVASSRKLHHFQCCNLDAFQFVIVLQRFNMATISSAIQQLHVGIIEK